MFIPGKIFLRKIVRGDCIGEMGVISEECRSAGVFSIQDSLLVRFTKNDFLTIMDKYPIVNRRLMKVLIKRLQNQSLCPTPARRIKKVA